MIMKSTLKIVIFLCLLYITYQGSFQCNVQGCQYCSFPNFCGLCNSNNLLVWSNSTNTFTCTPLNCAPNCNTCYINNTCQLCNSGYYLASDGTCSQTRTSNTTLPINCIYGTNSQTCTICAYGYSLQAGFCYPIFQRSSDNGCSVQQAPMICQICYQGYFVGPLGNCILMNQINQTTCNVQNCAYCSSSNGTCAFCMPGFQLTSQNTCTDNTCNSVANCGKCGSTSGQCTGCLIGYNLNSQTNTCQKIGYGCFDPNCIICDGYQSCGQCIPGYQIINFNGYNGNAYIPYKLCRKLSCPYNIQNCQSCTYQYNTLFNYQKVLCSNCNNGFILVNGYCVAQLSTTYTCSSTAVPNCASCSYNNFCGKCNPGYVLSPIGVCLPTICTGIPNCASCNANYVCSQCNSGYTLSQGVLSLSYQPISSVATSLLTSQCIPSGIQCKIANCAYCLTDGVCASCLTSYILSSNACNPTCNIANCFTCSLSNSTQCQQCNIGYNLVSGGFSCQLMTLNCTGCIDNTTNCYSNGLGSQGVCTQCQTGMILVNGNCVASTCNLFGCSICLNSICVKCNQGLLLTNGYCQQLNCNNGVAHCILCIQNNTCLGCQQGYLLVNSTGTPTCVAKTSCSDPNCLQCAGNPNQCTKCALPYNVSNNQCVCGFQNCLSCSTSGIACDSCPYPLFGSLNTQSCLPSPSLKHTCNVQDCEFCLTQDKCSYCAIGYTLNPTDYTCTLNNCTKLGLNFCQLCDNIGYVCHECIAGYMMSNFLEGGQCLPINPGYTCNISGCAVCSNTNNSICASCLPTYYSNGSTQCLPNNCSISNCYLCLQNNVCSQCVSGFALTGTSVSTMACVATRTNITNCQGQIQYCSICVINYINNNPSAANQKYCVQCQDGFEFDSTNSVCIPQTNNIPHCKIQSNMGYYIPPYCVVCQQGYFVNTYGLCTQYAPQTNNTNCTVYNCLYCGINSTQCSFCFAPWGISSTGVCQTNINICSANCQYCANSTTCFSCNRNYTLNAPNTCILCQVSNCQLCTQQNTCSQCVTGYSLTGNNACLTCGITNCNNCSDINICSSCKVNSAGVQLYPATDGGSCLVCDKTLSNMANCVSCNVTSSCGLCQNGYQLYIPQGGSGVCIQCNIQNCLSCGLNNGNVVCMTCAFGYSANGNSCTQCLYPCATCTTNQGPNICATCSTPSYFATALSNGTCVSNLIPNCVNYNTGNITLCSSCNTGYAYNSTTNACDSNCPQFCQACNNPTTCTQCVNGFFLASNGTCIQCLVSGCSACPGNGSICSTCFQGFYLIQDECRSCPGYCSKCTGNNSCSQLVQSNQQVLITVNNQVQLAVCQQNCLTCSSNNPQTCIQCANGFYLQNGNCFICSSNCLTCSTTNQDQCLTCYPNNFLSGSVCSTCNSNCLTCKSSNQPSVCMTCNDGFYLNGTTCVQGCPLNCLACSSPTTCTQCLSGYTVFTQNSQLICAPCTTSCRTCATGQPASCLSCGVGFYLSGNTCLQCSINCQNCQASGCISCIDGYFLTSTQSCSQNCILPCATCSSVTPTTCTSCIAGYTYNDISNTCNKILSCNGGCIVCPLGYSLNLGNCVACTSSQCQTCNPNSPSQCYSCLPGYFLNPSNNQCQACSSSCSTCLTSSGCTTCATGFTKMKGVAISASGYQCVACNSPCATCINTPDYCTSCVSGYQFFGWKCAQSFYFGFSVTLLTNLTTFNQNYYSFLLALTSSIGGSNPNAITILSISSGSVIVQGGAGPSGGSGSKQANNQYSSLDATLSKNGQIAGMPIGQSSVTVVGGSVDYKQVNLALILGICIPVGVLLIAGIVLYIYCKKKRSADVIEQKIKQNSGFTVRESFELSAHYKEEDTNRPFEQTTAIN